MRVLRTLQSRALVSAGIAGAIMSASPAMADDTPNLCAAEAAQAFNQQAQAQTIGYGIRDRQGNESNVQVTYIRGSFICVQEAITKHRDERLVGMGSTTSFYADGRILQNRQEVQFRDVNQRNNAIQKIRAMVQNALTAAGNRLNRRNQGRAQGRSAIQFGSTLLFGQTQGLSRQILGSVGQGRAIRDGRTAQAESAALSTFQSNINADLSRFQSQGRLQTQVDTQNSTRCQAFDRAVKSANGDQVLIGRLQQSFPRCRPQR